VIEIHENTMKECIRVFIDGAGLCGGNQGSGYEANTNLNEYNEMKGLESCGL
jgi:hypothetical protein